MFRPPSPISNPHKGRCSFSHTHHTIKKKKKKTLNQILNNQAAFTFFWWFFFLFETKKEFVWSWVKLFECRGLVCARFVWLNPSSLWFCFVEKHKRVTPFFLALYFLSLMSLNLMLYDLNMLELIYNRYVWRIKDL